MSRRPLSALPSTELDAGPVVPHARGSQAGSGAPEGALALLTPQALHPLPARGRLVVGSGPHAHCPVASPRVAAAHCAVGHDADGGLWVEDLGSEHGTWVRGQRVERAPLVEGDAVLVGREPILVVRAGLERWADAVRWRGLVGRARSTLATMATVARLAPLELPVLVHGESGVGKELVARALHAVSGRADGPWVAVNCAALTDTLAEATLFGVRRGAFTGATQDRRGVFEEADGGTLLLDEVGELSPALQAKLLRALEAREITRVGEVRPRPVDVRVVAATWRDLEAEATAGRFRHDLLHRLAVLRVEISPLRERPADIGPLYVHFRQTAARSAAAEAPAEARALDKLTRWPWPGNARELRNVALRDAVLGPDGGWRSPQSGPPYEPSEATARAAQPGAWHLQHEARHARATTAVWKAGGNRAKAARALGVSRSTLYRWLNLPGAGYDASADAPFAGAVGLAPSPHGAWG